MKNHPVLEVDVQVIFDESGEACELEGEPPDDWVCVDAVVSFNMQGVLQAAVPPRQEPRLGAIGRYQLGKLRKPPSDGGSAKTTAGDSTGRRGAKKRMSYSYQEKAAALEVYDRVLE
eukprot:gene31078-38985_t